MSYDSRENCIGKIKRASKLTFSTRILKYHRRDEKRRKIPVYWFVKPAILLVKLDVGLLIMKNPIEHVKIVESCLLEQEQKDNMLLILENVQKPNLLAQDVEKFLIFLIYWQNI